MIKLITGQQVINSTQIVVNGGDFNEEDNVIVVGLDGVESNMQAYYIINSVVYAEKETE
jgi:hypothetical protein